MSLCKQDRELLKCILKASEDMAAAPHIEGLTLCPFCDNDTSEVVGYQSAIYNEESQVTTFLWFDVDGNPLTEAPPNSGKCPDYENGNDCDCPPSADDIANAIANVDLSVDNSDITTAIANQTASINATLTAGFASVVNAINACCNTTNANLDAIETILEETQVLTESIDTKLQDICYVCSPERTCTAYNGRVSIRQGATGDQTLVGWYGDTNGQYGGPFGDDPLDTPLVWYNSATGFIPNVGEAVADLVYNSLTSTNNPTGQPYDISEVTATLSGNTVNWTAWRCDNDGRVLSMGVINSTDVGQNASSTSTGGTQVEPEVLGIRTDIGCTEYDECNCGGEA